jgi:hypothetical protein
MYLLGFHRFTLKQIPLFGQGFTLSVLSPEALPPKQVKHGTGNDQWSTA